MFKHILVPTDGSKLSSDTVRRAIAFAKETRSKVTFFFAKPDYSAAFYGEGALIDPTTPDKSAEMAEQQAKKFLRCIKLRPRPKALSAGPPAQSATFPTRPSSLPLK